MRAIVDDKGTIILVTMIFPTGRFSGTVIQSDRYVIGSHFVYSSEKGFKPYKGKVTLDFSLD